MLHHSMQWLAVGLAVAMVGCQRAAEPEHVLSKDTLALDAKLQVQVRENLTKFTGTPNRPKPLGKEVLDPVAVERGAKVYEARCAACHGSAGDGNGPQAAAMYPRPRDYRRGIFKFTATPYGAKPLRSDLVRTIKNGARGTSMPAFNLLPEEDLQAVVDHVISLTHRGEIETLVMLEAQDEDAIDPTHVPGFIDEVLAKWKGAGAREVLPVSREIPFSMESVERGKKAFLSEVAGCYKCHGNDGRGQTMANQQEFKDIWGFQTRAADLSSGMLHGGNRPLDIYRRIYSGINGTPMPAFNDKLANEPELFWNLVHYVQYISGARRRATLALQAEFNPPAPIAAPVAPAPPAGEPDKKGAGHGE